MKDREDYASFLARKVIQPHGGGLTTVPALNPALFPFQRRAVEFALTLGRAALFLGTGMGKTLCQLEWARVATEHTGAPVLVLTPLAVGAQTVREGARFGIECTRVREQSDVRPGINVTNYERLDKFDPSTFAGVVLDESGILKSFSGATRNALVRAFADTPFRLACTATPAPNDHMELGNHAEFLGLMAMNEMLQRWFINDTSQASQVWRLKGHAVRSFWDWVSSWAVCAAKPSDLGDDDAAFVLPPLELVPHVLTVDLIDGRTDTLFRMPELSATNLHQEKRRSAVQRAEQVATLVKAEPDEPWLIWCDTDYEADAITTAIPDAVEVRGSMTTEHKESRLLGFTDGSTRILLTKPRVAGFGVNMQRCARIAFVGVSYSFEQFYQSIRHCWRFGQKRPVVVHVMMGQTESAIWTTLRRKAGSHEGLHSEMAAATRRAHGVVAKRKHAYQPTTKGSLPSWL